MQGDRGGHNSPFAEWDKALGDPGFCAAIADRITFRCTLIQTGTDAYRYQSTRDEHRRKESRLTSSQQ